jgi:hypothetical protein
MHNDALDLPEMPEGEERVQVLQKVIATGKEFLENLQTAGSQAMNYSCTITVRLLGPIEAVEEIQDLPSPIEDDR